MQKLFIFCLIGIATIYAGFYISYNRAISRVMDQDTELAKKKNNLPKNASASQIAYSTEIYCQNLKNLYMEDCPISFQIAYKHHISAWRETVEAIRQFPDGFIEGFFVGFFNGLLRGEIDGGASRYQRELKNALNRVKTTWEEVERIAAQYGVKK